MEKRCSINLSKKILLTLALVLTSVALSVCVLMGILLPYSIAYADSTQNVLVAPVSNLEGNAYAIASTLELTNGDDTFLIPESYYITDISSKAVVPQYYQVKYCGMDFYFKAESLQLSGVEITADYTIKFLGYHTTDSTQIYVVAMLDGDALFGFAPRDSFEDFVVPYHPITQAERDRLINSKPAPDPEKGDIIPNTSLALRIILIIGIAVPAIIIAILLFKPSKNDRTQGKSVMRSERRKNDFDYDSSRTYRDDRYDNERNDYERGGSYQNNYPQGYDSRRDDDYRR